MKNNLLSHKVLGRTTKLQRTCARLSEEAHRLGPGQKMPTSVQLCEMLEVSPVTLSAALRELEERHLIERRHGVGIYVSTRLQRCISLLCGPEFFRNGDVAEFWRLLIERARERAQAQGETLRFDFALPSGENSAPLQESLMRDIQSGEVHGVLALGVDVKVAEWIEQRDVPLVALAGHAAHTVGWDSEEFIRLGVEVLAQSGCRRIALWRHGRSTEVKAFRRALAQHGLAYEAALVKNGAGDKNQSHARDLEMRQGERIAREVFAARRSDWPDGVLITDDNLTRGALSLLKQHTIRLGEELKIASHANRGSPVLRGYEDELMLLEYDSAELVRALFEGLELLMQGHSAAASVLVKPTLRQRTVPS